MSDRPSGGDMTGAFASALESAPATTTVDAAPASPTVTENTPAETAPTATVSAAVETPVPQSATVPTEADVAKGTRLPDGTFAPPTDRWPKILENQRLKAIEETETRLRQEYDDKFKPYQGIDSNVLNGYRIMIAAQQGDPQAIAHLKATAPDFAKAMGIAQEPASDPEPEPDFQSPDGTPFYSAQQQAKREAWLRKQFMQDVQKEIAPFKQAAQTFEQEKATAHYSTSLQSVVAQMEAADPVFSRHKKDVLAVINADPDLLRLAIGDERTQPNLRLALKAAWGEVHRTKVVPAQQQTAEAQTVANLQQRAVQATVNPSAPTTSGPKKFSRGEQGFAEALAHFGAVAGNRS